MARGHRCRRRRLRAAGVPLVARSGRRPVSRRLRSLQHLRKRLARSGRARFREHGQRLAHEGHAAGRLGIVLRRSRARSWNFRAAPSASRSARNTGAKPAIRCPRWKSRMGRPGTGRSPRPYGKLRRQGNLRRAQRAGPQGREVRGAAVIRRRLPRVRLQHRRFHQLVESRRGLRAGQRSVTFRGTYAQAVRAPNIAELFSPESSTLQLHRRPLRRQRAQQRHQHARQRTAPRC